MAGLNHEATMTKTRPAGPEPRTTKTDTDRKLLKIPLRNLAPSPKNVRRTDRRKDIETLARSLAEHGIIQNLTVERVPSETRPEGLMADAPTGQPLYYVVAGQRRTTALRLLAEKGRIPTTFEVPCALNRDAGRSRELSLVENIHRTRLNAVDEFEAYQAMVDDGARLEEIADRFNVTVRYVQQRLKLASLAPEVKAAGREGKLLLPTLEAFTISHDHKRQVEVLEFVLADEDQDDYEYSSSQDPHYIRNQLSQSLLTTDSHIVKIVGVEAYREAGGEVQRDLFWEMEDGENGNGNGSRNEFIVHPEIVERLLKEKTNAAADELRNVQPPWRWVEVRPKFDYQARVQYGHAGSPEPRPPEIEAKIDELAEAVRDFDPIVRRPGEESDEEHERKTALYEQYNALRSEWRHRKVYTAAERAISGCIVHIDHQGITIDRGLVKPGDCPDTDAGRLTRAQSETDTPSAETAETTGASAGASTPETAKDTPKESTPTDDPTKAETPDAATTSGADADETDDSGAADPEPEAGAAAGEDAPAPPQLRPMAEHEDQPEERVIHFTPPAAVSRRRAADEMAETPGNPLGPTGYREENPEKLVLKKHGMTSGNLAILRDRRMALVRLEAVRHPDILMDLFTVQHWAGAIAAERHPGVGDETTPHGGSRCRALGIKTDTRPEDARTVKPDGETGAAQAVARLDRMEAALDLDWLNEPNGAKQLQALRKLPLGTRKKLFAAAMASLMRSQLSIEKYADLAGEAAIEAMGIDWAKACRPDADYWNRVPMAWIQEETGEAVSTRFSRETTKGRKSEAADRLGTAFGPKTADRLGLDPDEQDRIEQWTIPGMVPRLSDQDPRVKLDKDARPGAEPTTGAATRAATGETPSDTSDTSDTSGTSGTPQTTGKADENGTRSTGETEPEGRAADGCKTGDVQATPEAGKTPTPKTTGDEADDPGEFDHTEATELPPFLQVRS